MESPAGTRLEKTMWRRYNPDVSLDDKALRSLVSLLDDEDPRSLTLVRQRLLDAGAAALPFLEEARAASEPALAARLDAMAEELRFRELRREFSALSRERVPDLETGALLLSRFSHPRVDAAIYSAWLDRVAAAAGEEIPEDAGTAEAVRRLAAHLFQAMGFAGNESNYYDPDNSCLSRVIDTRRGIPVTLSVLFLLLARRLKIPAYGVGTPGHFLLGYREDGEAHFLDPFRQGRRLDLAEVRRMLVRNGYEYRPSYLRPCGPREVLVRMMRNLLSIYQKTGAAERAERLSTLVEIMVTGRAGDEE
jgi:regulator of sirC expression with transglutaminase-like and TPR domain